MRRLLLLTSASSCAALAVAPNALAATSERVTTVELDAERARTFESRGDDAVHARRRAVARAGHRAVPHAVARRPAGARGSRRRPKPRTGPTPRSPEHAHEGLAAREPVVGGRLRSHPGARDRERDAGSGRTSSGARRRASRCGCRRQPSRRRSSRGRRGEPTRRSAAARRATPPTSASRSSITRPGKNGYSRSEAAAIVKGIQLFHVRGNGWNDIGYNFLVDRFGTIYEGRFGGVDRNVIGAHALGFNTGSVGIALLGTYEDAAPSAAAQDAIAQHRRLAARPRPRRPDRVPHVHLRRERPLRERDPGAAERRLGPPRHGLHGLPGRRPLRAARHDRVDGARARWPEDLRAEGDASRDRRSASARVCRSRRPGRSRSRAPSGSRGRARNGNRDRGRLDVGLGRVRCRARTAGRSRPARARPALGTLPRGWRRRAARDRGARRRARGDQPERRRPGGHDDAHLPDLGVGERHDRR